MTSAQIAQRLNEIAALMEFDGEPFFKIKAYERAARSLEDSQTPVEVLLESGELEGLPGIGKAISQKIADINRTGTCKYLEELRAKFPPTILELLGVPGIGAKTAVLLYRELSVGGLLDLRRVIDDGSIARVPRLGPKTIENIKSQLARVGDPRRDVCAWATPGRWPARLWMLSLRCPLLATWWLRAVCGAWSAAFPTWISSAPAPSLNR